MIYILSLEYLQNHTNYFINWEMSINIDLTFSFRSRNYRININIVPNEFYNT